MDMMLLYKYAYWGVINHLKTLKKLREMCIDVCDGDAFDEYDMKIEKVIEDLIFIENVLGYTEEERYNYEGK